MSVKTGGGGLTVVSTVAWTRCAAISTASLATSYSVKDSLLSQIIILKGSYVFWMHTIFISTVLDSHRVIETFLKTTTANIWIRARTHAVPKVQRETQHNKILTWMDDWWSSIFPWKIILRSSCGMLCSLATSSWMFCTSALLPTSTGNACCELNLTKMRIKSPATSSSDAFPVAIHLTKAHSGIKDSLGTKPYLQRKLKPNGT